MPFSLGNLILDNLSCMDVMDLKLMGEEGNLLPDLEIKSSGNSVDGENEDSSVGDSGSEVSFMVSGSGETRSGISSLLAMTSEDEMSFVVRESEEDGSSSLEGDPVLDSLSVMSDTSSLCGDDLLGFDANLETGSPFLEAQKSIYDVELIPRTIGTRNVGDEAVLGDSLSVEVIGDGAIQFDKGGVSGRGSRSIFEVDCVPLWGLTSVCGRRPEMEDAVAAVPRLLKIPLRMLIRDDRVIDALTPRLSHLTGHFYGVYDGHGGSQVSIYLSISHTLTHTHTPNRTVVHDIGC